MRLAVYTDYKYRRDADGVHAEKAFALFLGRLAHDLDGLVLLATRPEELDRELATKLAEWQGLLERQPIQSRQLLRKLLAGRVMYTPHDDERAGSTSSPVRPPAGSC